MRWSLVWLLIGASTTHAQSSTQAVASAMPVIAKADSEWLDAMRAHDVARIVAPYDSGAVFVMATSAVVRGRDAIANLYRSRFGKIVRVTDGGIVRDDMRAVNDTLIYEWGHGGLTYTDSSNIQHTSSGPYFTVWCKIASGRWVIIRNLVF